MWVLQCKMLLGICTSVLPRFLFGQYNFTRNLILGHPGPISVFLCLLVCLPVCPEFLGILSRYIQDDVKYRKLTVAVFSENLDYQILGDGPLRDSVFNFLSIMCLLTEHLKFSDHFRMENFFGFPRPSWGFASRLPLQRS